jgi:hypothetical protein
MTTEAKTDLATVPKGMEDMMTLDRPTGADEGTLGNEGIGRDDIAMPRIGLAQKMSPEIDRTNAGYIDTLEFTDLFHSLKRKNLGKGPLHFVILRRDDPRWIEWIPRDEGGGIRDKDVRANDPRTKFGPDGEKPIATEYHDFIVLMLTGLDAGDPLDSIVALSLKSSGIKAAKHLNFLISLRGPKLICKGVYALTTGHETDKKTQGVYATYKFANAGWLKPDSAIETLVVELFDAWKDRKVEIERVADDVDSFDPAKIEAEM